MYGAFCNQQRAIPLKEAKGFQGSVSTFTIFDQNSIFDRVFFAQEWDDTSKYTGTYSHGQKHGKGRPNKYL